MNTYNGNNFDIRYIKGIGQKRALLYNKLGVFDVNSLLRYYPRNYLNLTNPVSIAEIDIEKVNVFKAQVFEKQGEKKIRQGLSVFKVMVTDGVSNMTINIFNSKFMFEKLHLYEEYIFVGKVSEDFFGKQATNPTFFESKTKNKILPIYHLTNGLTENIVRQNMISAIESLELDFDPMPVEIKQKYKLCSLKDAIKNIHFPKDEQQLSEAKRRLVFEELLTFQLGLLMMKNENKHQSGATVENFEIDEFFEALPFELTDGQKTAINEAIADLKNNKPMKRLIQGDVGCGKTVVGAALCYLMAKNNYQSAFMAPTGILATQHYASFVKLLSTLGIKCGLLTGSVSAKNKTIIKQQIKNGEIDIVIGTHAILTDNTEFHSLGLVVTDEQHRFGVRQRKKLEQKGKQPHTLVMSATPIPRTLGLIIYGDLDISTIKQMPVGRQKIETYVITDEIKNRAYNFIKKHIDEGRQAYIVCPYIDDEQEESKAVVQYSTKLKNSIFKDYNIDVLHSGIKPKQKQQIMQDFEQNKINILVSTTVVEVGVDVPNAVIMLIEGAEHFGLSQLHQLRGRIGRGEHKSYCILVNNSLGEKSKERLSILANSSDGFEIAEMDLQQRGPGEFFGQKQHGLPLFKIANLLNDMETVVLTCKVAKELLENDKGLSLVENRGLRAAVIELMTNNTTF